jgi:hypothetical protein
VDGEDGKSRVESDLGDVGGVGGVGKGEGGDRSDGALEVLRFAAASNLDFLRRFGVFRREGDTAKEDFVVDLSALDVAFSAAGDEDVAVEVVGEAPRFAAMPDNGLDAVLSGEVEELEEGVLRGGDEVGGGLGRGR